jgi:hypothetical protein
MIRHPEAYHYLRLTWRPRKFDRVIFQNKRYRVERYNPARGIKLAGRAGWLYPGEVKWRPTPTDFNAVLSALQELWVYREVLPGNRQICGVRCNGRVIALKGRPCQVLSQVLSLRAIEPNVSVHINRFFEHSYSGKKNAIRIHALTTENRDPS